MKKKWQISLIIVLVILTLSSYKLEAEHNTPPDPDIIKIENWDDRATDETTFLDAEGSVHANVIWQYPFVLRPTGYWQLQSSAYASSQAAPLGQNTEYKVRSWVEVTVDTETAVIPGRGGINQERTDHDSNGRPYNYDSRGNQYSGVAYKKHPVSSTVKNWWEHFSPIAIQVTRSFHLSIYCYFSKTNYANDPSTNSGSDVDDNPMYLTADPYSHSFIEGNSMQYLNKSTSTTSITSP